MVDDMRTHKSHSRHKGMQKTSIPPVAGDATSANGQVHWDGNFGLIRDDLPTVFVLRHAERFYASDPSKDHACELTAQGKVDAERLGGVFLGQIGQFSQVLSSPADRCIETGRNIIAGNENQLPVHRSKYLAEAYVFNGEKAVTNFQTLQVSGVIQRQLAGDYLIGMRSKEEGTKLLLSTILPMLKSKETSLHVTHDAVLGTFFGTLIEGHQYDSSDLEFHFLDGICLQQDHNGEIILYRHGKAYNIAAQVAHLQAISQGDIALIFFALRDAIENAPLISYVISDIINPVMPVDVISAKGLPGILHNNYLWAGAHLLSGLTASYFLPIKDVPYTLKLGAPLVSSAFYFTRIEIIDYFKQLQAAHFDDEHHLINNTADFLNECSQDVVMYSFLGALNAIATKFLIPNLGNALVAINIFNNAAIGGLQCYAYNKESAQETPRSYADIAIPYLMDIAYVSISMRSNNFGSFSSFYEGFDSLKKGAVLLSGLVVVDSLSKLSLAILPSELKEQYINPPFEFAQKCYDQTIADTYAVFEDGMILIGDYFSPTNSQEEL
jgi:hypothetical protein